MWFGQNAQIFILSIMPILSGFGQDKQDFQDQNQLILLILQILSSVFFGQDKQDFQDQNQLILLILSAFN